MPSGYLHITRLASRTGTYDREIVDYQVNYVLPGLTYAIAFDEAQLSEFLLNRVPLSETEFEKVMTQLHEAGHANIGDVDIPREESSALGMEEIQDDF